MSDQYAFKTLRERVLASGSAVAGLAVFGTGLCAVFNPVALGAAGAYASYQTASSMLLNVPAYRKWAYNGMIKKGQFEAVSEDALICRITKEISDSLGRPEAPKIYTVDQKFVAAVSLPLGFRWLAKLGFMKKIIAEKAMPKVFGAIPGTNTLVTTKEALASKLPEAQLRFILAHEMAHLKTDNLSSSAYAITVVKKMSEPLLWVTAGATALSFAGVAVPLTLGAAAWQAFGALALTTYAAKAAINFGTRIKETRADRNALYITRDLKGAEGAMDYLHEEAQKLPHSHLKEASLTHPSYLKRMASLKKSFNAVSKYPPLQPVNDNAVPEIQKQDLKKAL